MHALRLQENVACIFRIWRVELGGSKSLGCATSFPRPAPSHATCVQCTAPRRVSLAGRKQRLLSLKPACQRRIGLGSIDSISARFGICWFRYRFGLRRPESVLDRACCYVSVSVSRFAFLQAPQNKPPALNYGLVVRVCVCYSGIGKGIGNTTGHKKHGKEDEGTDIGWAGLRWQMLLGLAGWAGLAGGRGWWTDNAQSAY